MADKAFFDTNVLVYAFDRLNPAKHGVARALLDRHVADGTFVASLQVLQEFFVTVTRKVSKTVSPGKAREIVAEFTNHRIVEPTIELLLRSIDLSIRLQFSLWDAQICAAALDAGCVTLFSEDLTHGQNVGGLIIRNPFGAGAANPRT